MLLTRVKSSSSKLDSEQLNVFEHTRLANNTNDCGAIILNDMYDLIHLDRKSRSRTTYCLRLLGNLSFWFKNNVHKSLKNVCQNKPV